MSVCAAAQGVLNRKVSYRKLLKAFSTSEHLFKLITGAWQLHLCCFKLGLKTVELGLLLQISSCPTVF